MRNGIYQKRSRTIVSYSKKIILIKAILAAVNYLCLGGEISKKANEHQNNTSPH